MGIHGKMNSKSSKKCKSREDLHKPKLNPLKKRKQRIQQKKAAKDTRRGFSDVERAATAAVIPHQLKQIKTNPFARIGISKKMQRKLDKAAKHSARERREKEEKMLTD